MKYSAAMKKTPAQNKNARRSVPSFLAKRGGEKIGRTHVSGRTSNDLGNSQCLTTFYNRAAGLLMKTEGVIEHVERG
jgi:hypothetical protein